MRPISKLCLSLLSLACLLPCGLAQPAKAAKAAKTVKGEYIAYVGTYTRPNKSQGIYGWRFHPASGKLDRKSVV